MRFWLIHQTFSSFQVILPEDETVLLHISAFNVSVAIVHCLHLRIYVKPFLIFDRLDEIIGNFSCNLRQTVADEELVKDLSEAADPRNLFPNCNVDQDKATIIGSCDDGVYFFCRNEFLPEKFFDRSSRKPFDDICDCVNLLCIGIPSAEGLSSGYQLFTQVVYGIFATITTAAGLIILALSFDLAASWCYYGKILQIL